MPFRWIVQRLSDRLSRLWRVPHANGEARLELHQPLWIIASLGLLIGYAVWPQPFLLTGFVVVIGLLLIGWGWARWL